MGHQGRNLFRAKDKMNPVDAYQRQLRGELATVEKEIKSRNQQIDTLNTRLEALKRALQLFESDQSAIAELLRTADPQMDGVIEGKAAASSGAARSTQRRTAAPARTQSERPAPNRPGKAKIVRAYPPARKAGQGGGLKRIDMIYAVLKSRPGLSVRELIAALGKQFGWRPTESGVTAHLYTNTDKFGHTKADRSSNHPVAWSLK